MGYNALEVFAVALGQSVLPGILSEDRFLLFPSLPIPRQRHDARVGHPLHGSRLRLLERLVQVNRHPGVSINDLLLDADHMHDREYPGVAIEGDLLLLVVREEAPDALVARGK